MEDLNYIQQRLDRLYAELAALKRYVIVHSSAEKARDHKAWKDLLDASAEISMLWAGPDALEEIRSQREK